MISVAIRQVGCHPWQLSAPLNNQYPGTIIRKIAGIAVRITLISAKLCEIASAHTEEDAFKGNDLLIKVIGNKAIVSNRP